MDPLFFERSNLLRGDIWHFPICLLLLTSVLSCNSSLDPKQYVQWVQNPENGLRVKKDQVEFYFDVQFLPLTYRRITLQRKSLSPDSLQYFSLTIGCNNRSDLVRYNAADQSELQRRLYYFSYSFQHDVFLEEHGRRYPCVLYHFQQSLNADNSRTFLLAFEGNEVSSEEATLIIESTMFDSLPLKFRVLKTDKMISQL